MRLTKLFAEFFESEKSAGLILILCTAVSLSLANSSFSQGYLFLWHTDLFSKPIEFWINDGLMAFFFLLVGLEIEREIYVGELSSVRQAMLPVVAALGGMIVPAAIHFSLNNGTASQSGFGIPMATDIAFSLGVLSLLGSRVPPVLKVFLTALAIVDDLGAITVIALFYSHDFSLIYFGLALLIFATMIALNRARFYRVLVYLILGAVMWFFMYRAGIHPTISGVLLAFAIPFKGGNSESPSYRLEHKLAKPVAFLVLPLFALANTAIVISSSLAIEMNANTYGIILGLFLGKPLGIFSFTVIGSAIGLCSIPAEINKKQVLGTGIVAGIGFTMAIFVTLLAFTEAVMIDSSKIAILIAAVLSGTIGYLWLRVTLSHRQFDDRPAS